MITPARMNVVPVEVLLYREAGRLDSTTIPLVVVDQDFREPMGSKTYGSAGGDGVAAQTEAQIVYQLRDKREPRETGEGEESRGHLTFRKTTFDALDSPVQKGDRIVKIGGVDVDYQVIEVRPGGHLRGGPTLMLVFFEQNREKVESVRG